MLHPDVEQILPGASPAAGKYIRNLEHVLTNLGHEIVEMSYVAIPGAKEAYTQLELNDNDIIYKDKTIIWSVLRYQKKILKEVHKDDIVIFYNVVYYDLGLISKLNKRGIKSLLILADHTGDMKENGNFIRGMIAKAISKDYKKFKYVIALSERARRFLAQDAHIEIMEGGINLDSFKEFAPPSDEGITRYMYAGTLTDVTGVDILLEAIAMNHDKGSVFYISGKGPLEEKVKEAASRDTRIKYIGFLPDDEYYQLMQKMNILVNPRNMDLEQNQNNFPSKVLEYLAAGRMVISTKFAGWEKFTDCFEFCDSSAVLLADAILKAKEKSTKHKNELFSHNRKRAEEFSWDNQARKIIDLVEMK